MDPKKEAITRLADAIYLVRTKPNDPFDPDQAFSLTCAWTVMLLMDHIESGQSRFVGDINITKYSNFGVLLDKVAVSDYAHEKAKDAAAELLRAMASHTPFKNVLAKVRMDLIKRRGAKIKSDWCRQQVDRAWMKKALANQWAETRCSTLQFHGPASGALCLETMAMITRNHPQEDAKFALSVFGSDHTSLLIAIVQLMFASLLHTYASAKLRFYLEQGTRTELLFEFDYTPPVWDFELVAA